MNKFLSIICAILLFATLLFNTELKKVRADRDRLSENQSALLSECERYRTESGKNALSVKRLQLSVDELKEKNTAITKVADDLKIKLSRVQSASASGIESQVMATTILRDTIIIRDSIVTNVQVFDWSDSWTDISGLIDGARVDLTIDTRDTLVQIVHKIPHKFLFIKWGCKAIKQEIVTCNPHTNITYSEYIEVK